MLAHRKIYDSRLMTVLVQVGASVSGAIAVAALVVTLWPKAEASVLPSIEQVVVQEAPIEVATPYVPTSILPDGLLLIEDKKPPPQFEVPSIAAPNAY